MNWDSCFYNVSYITVLKPQVRGHITAFTLANIFCWGVYIPARAKVKWVGACFCPVCPALTPALPVDKPVDNCSGFFRWLALLRAGHNP